MAKYQTLKLPVGLLEKIDKFVSRGDYTSRTDFIKEAIRLRIEDIGVKEKE